MKYLLDTNVVSELRKKNPAAPVLSWIQLRDPLDLHISVITIFEIRLGIELRARKDPQQGQLLNDWLQRLLAQAYFGRILPMDEAVAVRAAGLHVPDPRPERDAFIAATALTHSMTLITRNVTDFHVPGLQVHNPWVTN